MAKFTKTNTDVSQFLELPGKFHFVVEEINENAMTKNNTLYNGIEIHLSIVGGTESTQLKKSFRAKISAPNLSHRDGGEFATKVNLRLARAMGILPPAADGEEVEFDWQDGIGKQIVAFVKRTDEEDGKSYLNIDGAHIYHPHDEEVKDVPKHPDLLKACPKLNDSGKTTVNGTARKPVAAGSVDPNDL